jgi:hypothetical protein
MGFQRKLNRAGKIALAMHTLGICADLSGTGQSQRRSCGQPVSGGERALDTDILIPSSTIIAWTASFHLSEIAPNDLKFPMTSPAVIVARTPDQPESSASKKEPYAATVVTVISTKWSSVRSASSNAPRATPPPLPASRSCLCLTLSHNDWLF